MMKKAISLGLACCCLCSIGFTGCGAGGGSKGGYKDALEAAEAVLMAQYTRDAATIMKLLPPEGRAYWEDDKNLTENQLEDYIQDVLNKNEREHDDVSIEVSNNISSENDIEVVKDVNDCLKRYEITADETIYFNNFDVILDGEKEVHTTNDAYVYKYNGRWYGIYLEYYFYDD